ncbi:MAG: MFS transporter, partial [Gordonia amarae]
MSADTSTGSAVTPAGTPLALAALLAGTLVGTVGNNVVNVPLSSILAEFDAPLTDGVFVVVGFLLAFAASMPLAGWVGDRFGRRRVYIVALIATMICALGAATAGSLGVLIIWRTLGGVAAAPFAPVVMGLIQWLFTGEKRSRAIGAWASVNGLGQAIGPTMGGLVADGWGWRWVFAPLIPVAAIGLIGTLRYIPASPGTRKRLDVVGAATLTLGSAALVSGLAQIANPTPGAMASLVVGTLGLAWFVAHSLRVAEPFIDLRLAAESRFLRSTLAAFTQMFALGATLVAIPLYLVAEGASQSAAGLTLFAVPAVMVLLGP